MQENHTRRERKLTRKATVPALEQLSRTSSETATDDKSTASAAIPQLIKRAEAADGFAVGARPGKDRGSIFALKPRLCNPEERKGHSRVTESTANSCTPGESTPNDWGNAVANTEKAVAGKENRGREEQRKRVDPAPEQCQKVRKTNDKKMKYTSLLGLTDPRTRVTQYFPLYKDSDIGFGSESKFHKAIKETVTLTERKWLEN